MSAKEPTRNPQQFPTIEPFLLLSPFSPRWSSLHRGFFLPSAGWIPPVSGTICPPASRPASQNLHPLEQSARRQPTQSPDSPSQWKNPPAGKPSRAQKPPPTGTICPPASRPASQNLHPLEQSARRQVAQRPKTSTHWNNLPAGSPLKVQIPPVSGRIHPLASHPEPRNPHPLEQSARLQAARRPNPSSDWENYPAGTGILEA